MRLFFLFFIAFATGCSRQQTRAQQAEIDTTKLFDPFPEPQSAQDILMFKNSIVLFHSNFTINQNETEHSFDDFKDVLGFFTKNATAIKQKKFYLLIDSSTKFDKTTSVIDALRKNKIENYIVINYQEYFKPMGPVVVQTPTVITTTRKLYDSTYFLITISDRFILKIQNEIVYVKTGREVDRFI